MFNLVKNLRLGQVLIEGGFLTEDSLNQALAEQKQSNGKRLGDILVENGYINEEVLMRALSQRLNVNIIDLENTPIALDVIRYIPEEIAKKYELIPIKAVDNNIVVATNNPLDYYAFDELESLTGKRITPVLATKKQLKIAIQRYYINYHVNETIEDVNKQFDFDALENIRSDDFNDMMNRVESAPVVRLVNAIINQAYRMRASDIHIEPGEKDVRVRFRVDGELVEAMLLNPVIHLSLVTRFKIMASMDIAEKRIPQDGRFTMSVDSREINMRVSTLPTIFGEKIVIRLLGDSHSEILRLHDLGMDEYNTEICNAMLKKSNGIILVTGPTGSGKTTTIYAMLYEEAKPNVNVISLEDPVEKTFPQINQVHINEKAGLTFASGLRSILRQDPDIIMIGEIRDGETASIAARSAITGHKVLSTVHTNDAASTFMRLIDMGVEPYIVASSVAGVIAQRLVRLICPHCKTEYELTKEELLLWRGEVPKHFYHGKGCVQCGFTGYHGRTAVYEMILVDPKLREMIAARKSAQELKDYLKASGTRFLAENIMQMVFDGKTTVSEYLKHAYSLE